MDSSTTPQLLYCRCAWAKVVPEETKEEVLAGLCASGRAFESVADLCEMAAQKDARLEELASSERPLRIAACFRRAVKGLFEQAGSPLPESAEVLNMREEPADQVVDQMIRE